MSLWSFLRQPDVKERFKTEFPIPAMPIKKKLLAPPIIPTHAALVGTAFDYLLRFTIEHLNPSKFTHTDPRWIAESALPIILDKEGATGAYKKAVGILDSAWKSYNLFIPTGKISASLLRDTLLLAQLDVFYRAGYERGITNFGVVEQGDIQDLQNLHALINPVLFKAKDVCLLNPTFGEASHLIGGADADLIIDTMLIDIKTVKELKIQREYINELIGYYSLNTLYQMTGIPEVPILQRFGLYFSRYGHLHSIEIKDVINPKTYSAFLQWFKKRASHHGATGE